MKEYIILSNSNLGELEKAVQMKIEIGWEPQGGPFMSGIFKPMFNQAMVRSTTPEIREKEPAGIPFRHKSKN